MKSLFYTKRADLYLQLLALVAPFIWAVIINESSPVFYAYFTVGAVQIISCLVNKYRLDARFKTPQRRSYEKWLSGVFICFFFFLLPGLAGVRIAWGGMLIFAFFMLFVGAGMAIWYLTITADELNLVRKLYGHSKWRAVNGKR